MPAFLDLFMQSLFKPGSKINQDHKHKYIHILAYAASVVETWKKVDYKQYYCLHFLFKICHNNTDAFWVLGE